MKKGRPRTGYIISTLAIPSFFKELSGGPAIGQPVNLFEIEMKYSL